ncbi:MAG: hypothetical protein ABIO37_01730 [Caulobacteraceae bacterium]
MTASTAHDLRRQIRRMEGRGEMARLRNEVADASVLSFGHAPLDERFEAGGLSPGTHQAAGPGGAPFAFVCALLARLTAARPDARVLLVQEAGALREAGGLYGPGLQAMGLDPDRLALLAVRTGAEALRAGDEALKSGAAAAVVFELCDGAALADLSITRRFNLAVQRTGAFAFLVTPRLEATSAALTRWRVEPAPSVGRKRRLGPPAFALTLTRNRLGRLGQWTVEWDGHDRCFRPAAQGVAQTPAEAVPAPVVRPAADRPAAAGGGRGERSPGPYRQTG